MNVCNLKSPSWVCLYRERERQRKDERQREKKRERVKRRDGGKREKEREFVCM